MTRFSMTKVGTFKIEGSFKLPGRGIIVVGQIIDGFVTSGTYAHFKINNESKHLQIAGIEMVDININKGEDAIGLRFLYKNDDQRKEFEEFQLHPQLIDLIDEPGAN